MREGAKGMHEPKQDEYPYQLWREQVTPAPQTIPISSISVIVPLDNAEPWCGQICFIRSHHCQFNYQLKYVDFSKRTTTTATTAAMPTTALASHRHSTEKKELTLIKAYHLL